jgi:DNA-binding MarR family transcriptional regulator
VFDLSSYLPYLLNRVGFAVTDAFNETLAEEALSVPSWRVLAVLFRDGSLRIGQLAELTSIELSTLSRLIGTLQRRNLVQRKTGKNDARVVNVALTARGRSTTARLLPAATGLESRLVDGMPAEEVVELKRLLDRLYANITRGSAENAPLTQSA